jgi:hypothetical protein
LKIIFRLSCQQYLSSASATLNILPTIPQKANHQISSIRAMAMDSRLASMRSRLLDFEKNMEERIQTLHLFESEIVRTGQLRHQWLTNVTKDIEGDTELFLMKVKVKTAMMDLLAVQLTTENAKVENFQDTISLQNLIAATKPYDGDDCNESRKKVIDLMMQNNIQNIKDALCQSATVKANLQRLVDDLLQNIESLKVEHSQQCESIVTDLQPKIAHYAIQLRESLLLSKANDKQITGDYLVLRHNCRVATEILIRSQNEANLARQALQEKLCLIALAASDQIEKVEKSSETELTLLTNGIRLKLMRSEKDLETLQEKKAERIRTSKNKLHNLTMMYDLYESKYETLQIQRRNDLDRVGGELRRLREMVGAVEMRLLKLSVTEDDHDFDKFVDNKENRLLEKNSRAIIENLENRLRLLRRGYS